MQLIITFRTIRHLSSIQSPGLAILYQHVDPLIRLAPIVISNAMNSDDDNPCDIEDITRGIPI